MRCLVSRNARVWLWWPSARPGQRPGKRTAHAHVLHQEASASWWEEVKAAAAVPKRPACLRAHVDHVVRKLPLLHEKPRQCAPLEGA